jgi:hypothetical protein
MNLSHGRPEYEEKKVCKFLVFPSHYGRMSAFYLGIGSYHRREAAAPRFRLRPGGAPENGCHGFITQ